MYINIWWLTLVKSYAISVPIINSSSEAIAWTKHRGLNCALKAWRHVGDDAEARRLGRSCRRGCASGTHSASRSSWGMPLMDSAHTGRSVSSAPKAGGSPGLGRPTWSPRPCSLVSLPRLLWNNRTGKGPGSGFEGATVKSNGCPSSVLGWPECRLRRLFSNPAGRL